MTQPANLAVESPKEHPAETDELSEEDWGFATHKSRLSKETKIGLGLIAVLLLAFGFVVYNKLSGSVEETSEESASATGKTIPPTVDSGNDKTANTETSSPPQNQGTDSRSPSQHARKTAPQQDGPTRESSSSTGDLSTGSQSNNTPPSGQSEPPLDDQSGFSSGESQYQGNLSSNRNTGESSEQVGSPGSSQPAGGGSSSEKPPGSGSLSQTELPPDQKSDGPVPQPHSLPPSNAPSGQSEPSFSTDSTETDSTETDSTETDSTETDSTETDSSEDDDGRDPSAPTGDTSPTGTNDAADPFSQPSGTTSSNGKTSSESSSGSDNAAGEDASHPAEPVLGFEPNPSDVDEDTSTSGETDPQQPSADVKSAEKQTGTQGTKSNAEPSDKPSDKATAQSEAPFDSSSPPSATPSNSNEANSNTSASSGPFGESRSSVEGLSQGDGSASKGEPANSSQKVPEVSENPFGAGQSPKMGEDNQNATSTDGNALSESKSSDSADMESASPNGESHPSSSRGESSTPQSATTSAKSETSAGSPSSSNSSSRSSKTDQRYGGYRPAEPPQAEAGSTTVVRQPEEEITETPVAKDEEAVDNGSDGPSDASSDDGSDLGFEPPKVADGPENSGNSAPTGNASPSSGLPEPSASQAESSSRDAKSTSEEDGTYVVQQDDNFWSIAKDHYGTGAYFQALARHNRDRISDPKKLRPGMTIAVPSPDVLQSRYPKLSPAGSPDESGSAAGSKPASESVEPKRTPGSSSTEAGFFRDAEGTPKYRVGSHDTLTEIAERHLGRSSRWIQIFAMNRDRLKNPNDLDIGTVLKLPGDASRVQVVSEPDDGR